MEPTLILWLSLGWLTYWLVKLRAVVHSSTTPISSVGEFLQANVVEIPLSIIGAAYFAVGAPGLPPEVGELKNPLTAFLAGGSAPSMFNNVIQAFFKK